MGAGQIGGMAAMVEFDFQNNAGFLGEIPSLSDAQFLVYFMSHTVLFCAGVLLEPHVVLTAASCVYAETEKFQVWAGTHLFREEFGVERTVQNVALHKGFNESMCFHDNLALLVLDKEYRVRTLEPGGQYVVNRINYAAPGYSDNSKTSCFIYGWGSRRNGLLMPMLLNVRRVNVTLLPEESCEHSKQGMLCIQEPVCKNDRFGELCPDDMGSVLVCDGHVRGIQVSRVVNRYCGYGFLDLERHSKFFKCGVDDARDITCVNCHIKIRENKVHTVKD